MASTEQLPSGKYRGIYYDRSQKPPRRTVPGTYTKKKDALHAAQEKEVVARRRAPQGGVYDAKMTWADWCEIWWPKRKLQKTTAKMEGNIRERELIPTFGHIAMRDISEEMIQDWVDDMARRGSASYAIRQYTVFRASMRRARKVKMLRDDPCEFVEMPRATNTGERRHIEEEDIASIRKELTDRYRDVVDFILETGLRPSEMCGLHWNNIIGGWLIVADSSASGVYEIKPPKDGDKREVPLTAKALEILARWRQEIPPKEGCGYPHQDGKPCRSDLVVRQTNGRMVQPHSLQDSFRRAAERAGIQDVIIYALRHTFATRLAEAGVDQFEIARLMGHATPNQSSTYVHRTDAARNRFLTAMGDHGTLRLAWNQRGNNLESKEFQDVRENAI